MQLAKRTNIKLHEVRSYTFLYILRRSKAMFNVRPVFTQMDVIICELTFITQLWCQTVETATCFNSLSLWNAVPFLICNSSACIYREIRKQSLKCSYWELNTALHGGGWWGTKGYIWDRPQYLYPSMLGQLQHRLKRSTASVSKRRW